MTARTARILRGAIVVVFLVMSPLGALAYWAITGVHP